MAISIQRVVHVNVNCSDLQRSLRFYRDFVGLTPMSHTRPVPQDGAGFGLEGEVQWDAHLLHDARGILAPAIDLLEWKSPRPMGSPYPCASQLGLYRMAFLVEDIRACQAELERQGVEATPPAFLDIGPDLPIAGVWALFFRDPDGTCLELIESPKLEDRDAPDRARAR